MYHSKLRPSRVKNPYKLVSVKKYSVLTVESSLEFRACFHFEYSDAVVSFEAQPKGFHYCYEGKTLPYTPDFRIVKAGGIDMFVEVKPNSVFSKPDVRQRFIAKKSLLKTNA